MTYSKIFSSLVVLALGVGAISCKKKGDLAPQAENTNPAAGIWINAKALSVPESLSVKAIQIGNTQDALGFYQSSICKITPVVNPSMKELTPAHNPAMRELIPAVNPPMKELTPAQNPPIGHDVTPISPLTVNEGPYQTVFLNGVFSILKINVDKDKNSKEDFVFDETLKSLTDEYNNTFVFASAEQIVTLKAAGCFGVSE